jgi:hypothetical protein
LKTALGLIRGRGRSLSDEQAGVDNCLGVSGDAVIWGGDGHRRGGAWKQAGEPKDEEIRAHLIEDKHEDLLK